MKPSSLTVMVAPPPEPAERRYLLATQLCPLCLHVGWAHPHATDGPYDPSTCIGGHCDCEVMWR